ncbi:MAG: hypothetical protein KAI66_14890 [Lentisphaeria bacterium]|nr:hypothetical protein [Lentisphaeria bacterium]
MNPVVVCPETNDLFRTLKERGLELVRCDSYAEARGKTSDGDAVLLLADGYPEKSTAFPADAVADALCGERRLFVEYPQSVPAFGLMCPQQASWERCVVASDVFGEAASQGRILKFHACSHVSAKAAKTHLALARVAGFDTAVYGLPKDAHALLFEHELCPDLLVATTKLSQFVAGRHGPQKAWSAIWIWILKWLSPDLDVPELVWDASVRPTLQRDAEVGDAAERSALIRGAEWFGKARLFVHAGWGDGTPRAANGMPDGVGSGPGGDRKKVGDGSLGMIEGASSEIKHDGLQAWRYGLRFDCMGEASMALALAAKLVDKPEWGKIAANLNSFLYETSHFADGARADRASQSYGLVCWTGNDAAHGVYYGDDNARALLGSLAAAATLGEDRWNTRLTACLLGNLRTTGPQGFRGNRLEDDTLQEKGWRHYWETDRTNFAPHYESWLWACFLVAYEITGFEPFLERAEKGIRMTMEAYPDKWRWTNGMQQERARMLLPLAWLVRVRDTDEHRGWLRKMGTELLGFQDACGAIREEVGKTGTGSYGPPKDNASYGVSEAPLLQQNGDPVCDLLYTTNFALVGLHEAAAATGDELFKEGESRLAQFLCRIQVLSQDHPELDGAWFRAFDYKKWDYWGSNADLGWGVWSIESGWTQAWITSVLAMRQKNTNLWDTVRSVDLKPGFSELADFMFSQEL